MNNTGPVTIVGTKQGGVIEVIENHKDPQWMFHMMVKQGERYAHMLAKPEFIPSLPDYTPGYMIIGARILIKEQMEPFEPEDPLLYLKKKKDGKVCTVNGKPIYQKMYMTHDKSKHDIIIKED